MNIHARRVIFLFGETKNMNVYAIRSIYYFGRFQS
jgi:hypothetical protein